MRATKRLVRAVVSAPGVWVERPKGGLGERSSSVFAHSRAPRSPQSLPEPSPISRSPPVLTEVPDTAGEA